MRTTLSVPVIVTNNIPSVGVHTHNLPEMPGVTCVDFTNHGNACIPSEMKHLMLVPEGTAAPNLDSDRHAYSVPTDYCEVDLLLSIGHAGENYFVVAQMTVRTSTGETSTIQHVPCPVN